MADPLILLTAGQQLPPQIFIHPAIPPQWARLRKATRRHDHATSNAPGAALAGVPRYVSSGEGVARRW
jgi:hypothetical protein